jgi:GntR family transcriptional regulator
MMFTIQADDPTPLYAQIERAIRVAIATGRLKLGGRLPTVRQLAVELRVNANTVAKVYGELEHAGVLETRRGVGTFVRASEADAVSPSERVRRLAELTDRFLVEAVELGYSVDEVLEQIKRRPSS